MPIVTEHLMLKQQAECTDDDEHDREREEPVARRLDHPEADVAAQQIERAVGEVDVAHQAEHQREAGRDEKVERPERDAGQDRVKKDPLAAHGLLEAGRPRRNDQPCQPDDQHEDDERPNRMARTEVLQGTHAATSRNKPTGVIDRALRRCAFGCESGSGTGSRYPRFGMTGTRPTWRERQRPRDHPIDPERTAERHMPA
jgi:hypothetical protein